MEVENAPGSVVPPEAASTGPSHADDAENRPLKRKRTGAVGTSGRKGTKAGKVMPRRAGGPTLCVDLQAHFCYMPARSVMTLPSQRSASHDRPRPALDALSPFPPRRRPL